MRTSSVMIDGEVVRLECAALTVREYTEVLAMAWPRGMQKDVFGSPLTLERVRLLDQHLGVCESDLVVNDIVITRGIAQFFAAREDVLVELYHVVIEAQHLGEEMRQNLLVAVRFSDWLSRQRATSHWAQTGLSCGRCQVLEFCKRRGCDAVERKKPVWHDKRLVLTTCPVLRFTPEVESTLMLFYGSHEFDGERWRQRHLIAPGSLLDQDMLMTQTMEWLRSVHMQLVQDVRKDT